MGEVACLECAAIFSLNPARLNQDETEGEETNNDVPLSTFVSAGSAPKGTHLSKITHDNPRDSLQDGRTVRLRPLCPGQRGEDEHTGRRGLRCGLLKIGGIYGEYKTVGWFHVRRAVARLRSRGGQGRVPRVRGGAPLTTPCLYPTRLHQNSI